MLRSAGGSDVRSVEVGAHAKRVDVGAVQRPSGRET
jgi:hypothetical protein